jgi:hypothetical protein
MLRLREMFDDPDHPIHRPLDEAVQSEPKTLV